MSMIPYVNAIVTLMHVVVYYRFHMSYEVSVVTRFIVNIRKDLNKGIK